MHAMPQALPAAMNVCTPKKSMHGSRMHVRFDENGSEYELRARTKPADNDRQRNPEYPKQSAVS